VASLRYLPRLMKRILCFSLLCWLGFFSTVYGQTPSISISTPFTDVCAGAPYVFTATAQNGGTAPNFQWQVMGNNTGTNSPALTLPTAQAGLVVRCVLTVTNGNTTTTVTSNEITLTSSGEKTPEVEITASTTTICAGGTVTFTAHNRSNHHTPSWEWTVNGAPAGTNSPTFSTNTLTNGAVVACRMRVPHCGGQGSTKDDSNPITISIKPLTASVSITTASSTVCRGSLAQFTAAPKDGGPNPVYQWMVNGAPAGNNSATFRYAPTDGDEVQCLMTPDPTTGCGGTAVSSNTVKLKVTEGQATTIVITASSNNECAGVPVQFMAAVQGAGSNPSYQWEVNGTRVGTNSPTYTNSNLADGDRVLCILSATNTPCALASVQQSNIITVQVKPSPLVTVSPAEAVVKGGTIVPLTATVGGNTASYHWEPALSVTDAQSLTPSTLPLQQTTTFRFSATGDNGCTVVKEVLVRVGTKLYLPNSFTPNGDGLNDLFRIPPASLIELKELAVYDRWGARVFYTTDAAKGWDGRHKGKEANAGVYVYTLSGQDDKGKVALRGTVLLTR